ncbi:ectonucleoside triphosphate diphosphohydrolase 2-like [Huso huso]|uniref:Ectonucleoside triphosphate diphosphohydrolase 2-like n=1 Tax=Huso huso TaxID=61971 RepID=A0ABR0Z7U0_HUSHU
MEQKAGVACVAALLLLAGVVGIILLAGPTKDVSESPDYKYGIVLDAGSSHTAMYIYKWPANKENDTGIVSEHSQCKVKGAGISSYASNPPGAGQSLVGCLDQAVQDVPKVRHAQTPIYLGATAGMRLLNQTSPSDSDRVLSTVASTIRSYPFDFRGARILTGQEEGVFGWVTVNYLLENFVKYGWVGRWVNPSRDTVGAMDFGGASTQITFVTQEKVQSSEDEMNLRLYGQGYRVYTHSFLCYGRDQVLKKVLSKVFKSQGYGKAVTHPCWPAGYSAQVTLGSVYDSPCTAHEKPSGYRSDYRVQVTGIGDWQQCRSDVSQIFDFQTCAHSKCSFNGVFQPNVSGNFMAFAAFYYTHSFMQRTTGIRVGSVDELDRAVQGMCAMKFDEMLQKAPDQQARIQDYCTIGIFMQLLTTQGYKFDNSTFPSISFQRKAADTSIGWALGYMLNLSNMIPAESLALRKGMQFGAWVALLILFVLVILCTLLLQLQLLYRSKKEASVI